MKEWNKMVELISYALSDVQESDLSLKTYGILMDDLSAYINVDKGYKMKALDMFASDSFIKENIREWIDYKSMDVVPFYQRNNTNYTIDIHTDPNNMTINPESFDIVFTIGTKFAYGLNHNSLLSVERILKPGGILVVSLSKFWYFKQFSQMLIANRIGVWEYIRAIEVNYKIKETQVETSKYFCVYRRK